MDLIEGKGGLIQLLDGETHFKLGTDGGFTEKTWASENPFFIKPKSTVPDAFGIRHYAGDVMYTTTNFLEKNADTLKDDVRELFSSSSKSDFIRSLLPPVPEEVKSGRVKRTTVASSFRTQMAALRSEITSTKSHFIRCVKPNPACNPLCADKPYVLSQLNSAGVRRGGCPSLALGRRPPPSHPVAQPPSPLPQLPPQRHLQPAITAPNRFGNPLPPPLLRP